MNLWHKNLEDRFASFPSHQQIIMVCTELNRAHNLQDNSAEYKNCLERALELMDFLISDPKWQRKLTEVLRGRDVIARYYLAPPQPTMTLQRTLLQLDVEASRLLIYD
jgi:hypothetical protein